MWYYYSDCHKGFCIEFDGNNSFFNKAFQIHYTYDYPIIYGDQIMADPSQGLNLIPKAFLHKSEEWKIFKSGLVMDAVIGNWLLVIGGLSQISTRFVTDVCRKSLAFLRQDVVTNVCIFVTNKQSFCHKYLLNL